MSFADEWVEHATRTRPPPVIVVAEKRTPRKWSAAKMSSAEGYRSRTTWVCGWCDSYASGIDEEGDPECERCARLRGDHRAAPIRLGEYLAALGKGSVEACAAAANCSTDVFIGRALFLGVRAALRPSAKAARRNRSRVAKGTAPAPSLAPPARVVHVVKPSRSPMTRTARWVNLGGQRLTMTEAAEAIGSTRKTLRERAKKTGMSLEQVIDDMLRNDWNRRGKGPTPQVKVRGRRHTVSQWCVLLDVTEETFESMVSLRFGGSNRDAIVWLLDNRTVVR